MHRRISRNHVHVDQIEWKGTSSYPPELRKVYRWKALVGGDEQHWYKGWKGIPLGDILTGVLELDPGAYYPLHLHPAPEIYYVIRGLARWTVGKETFLARPGTAVYHPPNAPHRMINIGKKKLEVFWIWFAPHGHTDVFSVGSRLVEPMPPQKSRSVKLKTLPEKLSRSGRTGKSNYVHAGEIKWTSSESYPAELRKVLRWKGLVGGDEGGWYKGWRGVPSADILTGVLELDPGAYYPLHVHPAPEIYYVITGRARWTVGEETFMAKPGMAVYHPSNTIHRMINIGKTKLETFWIDFAPGGRTEVFDVGSRLVEPMPTQK